MLNLLFLKGFCVFCMKDHDKMSFKDAPHIKFQKAPYNRRSQVSLKKLPHRVTRKLLQIPLIAFDSCECTAQFSAIPSKK